MTPALLAFLLVQQVNLPQCGPLAAVLAQLTGKYREQPALGLLSSDGKAMTRLYVNPDTQTWTLVAIGADFNACIMAAGQGVVSSDQPKKGSGS